MAPSARPHAAGLFTAVAVGQMYVWAVKKHRRYRKEFGAQYPRGRKGAFGPPPVRHLGLREGGRARPVPLAGTGPGPDRGPEREKGTASRSGSGRGALRADSFPSFLARGSHVPVHRLSLYGHSYLAPRIVRGIGIGRMASVEGCCSWQTRAGAGRRGAEGKGGSGGEAPGFILIVPCVGHVEPLYVVDPGSGSGQFEGTKIVRVPPFKRSGEDREKRKKNNSMHTRSEGKEVLYRGVLDWLAG